MRSPRIPIAMRYPLLPALSVALLISANVGSAQPSAGTQSLAPASERHFPLACSEIPARTASRIHRDDVLTWREHWLDTSEKARASSAGLDPRVLAEVRACMAGQSVATTRPEQLIGLGTAYLVLNDTVHAAEAFERVIKLGAQRSIAWRAFDLSRIVNAYMGAELVPQALSYMARLDALGPEAAGQRIKAHNNFFQFASNLDSIPLMAAEANAARLAANDLRGDARQEWLFPWQMSAALAVDLEYRRKHYAEARRVKAQASAAWDSVRPGSSEAFWARTVPHPGVEIGDTAPLLVSQLAYRPGETKPLTTPLNVPVRGKVSLVFFVMGGLEADEMQTYGLITQLRRKFPASMLDITLATMTHGVSWQTMKVIDDPQEEGELIRSFFHEYLRLPVPVAVRTFTFTKDPKTGHRTRVGGDEKDPYRAWGVDCIVVDKFGIVRGIRSGGGRRLENMIRELWAE